MNKPIAFQIPPNAGCAALNRPVLGVDPNPNPVELVVGAPKPVGLAPKRVEPVDV